MKIRVPKTFACGALFLILLNSFLYGYDQPSDRIGKKSFNSSQVLPTGHWIYNSLKILGMEQKLVCFNENSMMTVSELRFYFEQLDSDLLSPSGKKLYEEAEAFLYENESLVDLTPFRFDIGAKLTGELYYKSSD